jgi:hypothetical protein
MAIRKKTNVSPLDELTDQERNLVRDGADAVSEYRDFSRRSFELWMRMARGVALLLDLADRRTSRSARRNLLREQGYGTLHPTICIKLRIMARHETAIRFWRDGLTQNQREKWNSPTSVCNRCPAVRKAYAEARADKPPRRPRAANKSVALERALDVMSDYFNATEDVDAKAVLRERLTSLTRAGEPDDAAHPLDQAVAVLVDHLKSMDSHDRINVLYSIVDQIGMLDVMDLEPKSKPEPTPTSAKRGRGRGKGGKGEDKTKPQGKIGYTVKIPL